MLRGAWLDCECAKGAGDNEIGDELHYTTALLVGKYGGIWVRAPHPPAVRASKGCSVSSPARWPPLLGRNHGFVTVTASKDESTGVTM